jgi:hypothetical protein
MPCLMAKNRQKRFDTITDATLYLQNYNLMKKLILDKNIPQIFV